MVSHHHDECDDDCVALVVERKCECEIVSVSGKCEWSRDSRCGAARGQFRVILENRIMVLKRAISRYKSHWP